MQNPCWWFILGNFIFFIFLWVVLYMTTLTEYIYNLLRVLLVKSFLLSQKWQKILTPNTSHQYICLLLKVKILNFIHRSFTYFLLGERGKKKQYHYLLHPWEGLWCRLCHLLYWKSYNCSICQKFQILTSCLQQKHKYKSLIFLLPVHWHVCTVCLPMK